MTKFFSNHSVVILVSNSYVMDPADILLQSDTDFTDQICTYSYLPHQLPSMLSCSVILHVFDVSDRSYCAV